ncbi:phage tail protein [Hymenobacter negativus]|uniref:Phage tail protein n=1 Tax=Hymenobacter negativus TaxID=2795026 RepID=A0ABS3QJP9_9BACT|nr:tail fiber protein [Hymenobacter negativus]MBO2010989.1 phage tail protein [Hymenobacter negativus]
MNESFLGELRPIGFGYAPKGWMLCQGQTLPIAQNQALFSLLGTTYGGNGQTTFNLPDLRSRVPIGQGQLLGQSNYVLGQTGGVESQTLLPAQLPSHSHVVQGTMVPDTATDNGAPTGEYIGTGTLNQYSKGPKNAPMAANAVTGTASLTGNSQPHENRQPYIAMNYAICLQGIFPSRG